MIVKLKEKNPEYTDLTPDQPYFVVGIEADDYRILNDYKVLDVDHLLNIQKG